jgi:hypothetical protein
VLPEPIPDRGPDEEPDRSSLPGEAWDGPEQGLFVCLPAEELTLAGFADDGRADTMEPGPLLATVVDAVTGDDAQGLAGLSDDQLTGIISRAWSGGKCPATRSSPRGSTSSSGPWSGR